MDVCVRESRFGRGVFAQRDFAAGEVILRLTGRPLTLEEAMALGPLSFHTLQVAPRLYLELDPPGHFLNHSCEPNAGVREGLFIVALRYICCDEEILFDYSTTMQEDPESMECRCGTSSCRSIVANFETLPDPVRMRYLTLDIVAPFIARSYGTAQGGA